VPVKLIYCGEYPSGEDRPLSISGLPKQHLERELAMKFERWVKAGVITLAMTGGTVSAADFQQWRPPALGVPAVMPIAPMPPLMPYRIHDPRFRPVPAADFMSPRKAAAPVYPGQPFVSVQGQEQAVAAAQPAFTKQYAWRPADRPSPVAPRQIQVDDRASSPMLASAPVMPAYPMGGMPGTYGGFSHPVPFGMLPPPPPPPMPLPGAYGMASGFPSPIQHPGIPGAGFAAPLPPAPPWFGGGNYMAPPAMFGYPPPITPPWMAPWTAAQTWSRPGYGSFGSATPALGGVRSTYPLAGLY